MQLKLLFGTIVIQPNSENMAPASKPLPGSSGALIRKPGLGGSNSIASSEGNNFQKPMVPSVKKTTSEFAAPAPVAPIKKPESLSKQKPTAASSESSKELGAASSSAEKEKTKTGGLMVQL